MIKGLNIYGTIGELPTSYMISLTYEEQLIEINKKLNEIINAINDFSYEEIEKMITNAIQDLKNYVDNKDKEIYNYVDEKDLKVINELTILINQKIQYLKDYIDNNLDLIDTKIDQKFNELEEEIKNITIDNIYIYNPTTGKYDNIQNVVYDLYKYLRYHGITASEFDTLNLTAEDYDDKEITARNFDLYSKDLLLTNFNHFMFSPFTGEITKISDVVNTLANLHKEAPISAEDFDLLELSAKDFDDKLISAKNFDFNAEVLLSA